MSHNPTSFFIPLFPHGGDQPIIKITPIHISRPTLKSKKSETIYDNDNAENDGCGKAVFRRGNWRVF
jgi:hypothetical protein